jgi:hypothetical protein
VFRRIRGKVAIFNELLHGLAAKHGALVADQWSLKSIQRADFWSVDRLHLNAYGHHEVARMVLDVLDVPNDLEPSSPAPLPEQTWREARVEDLHWTREHRIPWSGRRSRGGSSGDSVSAKRPEF